MVAAPSSASTPCRAISASVAMTPGPPALVTIARRGPAGRRWRPTSSAQWKISPISPTRTTPARANAASYTASSEASAPVCEAAALADSVNRPALNATIGLERANARAAVMNSRASVSDSM